MFRNALEPPLEEWTARAILSDKLHEPVFSCYLVYYKFSIISLLTEPLMLITGVLFLFAACIVYRHSDMSISKSSPSYIVKLQWDDVHLIVFLIQVHIVLNLL